MTTGSDERLSARRPAAPRWSSTDLLFPEPDDHVTPVGNIWLDHLGDSLQQPPVAAPGTAARVRLKRGLTPGGEAVVLQYSHNQDYNLDDSRLSTQSCFREEKRGSTFLTFIYSYLDFLTNNQGQI